MFLNKLAYTQNFDYLNNYIFNKININPALTAFTDTSELKLFVKNKFNSPTQDSYGCTFEMPIKKHNIGIGISASYSDFYWYWLHTTEIYEKNKQIRVKAFFRKGITDKLKIGGFLGFVKHDGSFNSYNIYNDNVDRLTGGIGIIYKKENLFFGANIKTDNINLIGFQYFHRKSISCILDYCFDISRFNIESFVNFTTEAGFVVGSLLNYRCKYININYLFKANGLYKNGLEISLGGKLLHNRIKLSIGYEFQFNYYNSVNNDGVFNSDHQNSVSMLNYKFY